MKAFPINHAAMKDARNGMPLIQVASTYQMSLSLVSKQFKRTTGLKYWEYQRHREAMQDLAELASEYGARVEEAGDYFIAVIQPKEQAYKVRSLKHITTTE